MNGNGITVVIPTKNRHADLMVALRSVASQSRIPDEIVIIDQSAEEINLARRHDVQGWFAGRSQILWIHDRSIPGLVAAKREGVRISSYKIVCFLEDDVVLDPDFISELVDAMHADDGLVGCSGVVTDVPFGPAYALLHRIFHRGLFDDPRPWIYSNWRRLETAPIPSIALSGGLSAWRRMVFEHVSFDTINGFHMLEDIDFSTRVAMATKQRMAIIPTARLEHHFAHAGRASMGHREARKVCEYITFLRTRPHRRVDLLWLGWVLVGVAMMAIATSAKNRSFRPVAGMLRGLRDGTTRRVQRITAVSQRADAPSPTPSPSWSPDPQGSPRR